MSKDHYVYLVEFPSGIHKIGMTQNPKKRLDTMMSNCGSLVVLATWKFKTKNEARFVEKFLHCRMYKFHKHRREFFKIPKRVLAPLSMADSDKVYKYAEKERCLCKWY